MSKTNEKPLYPSQVNTKAIACRISSIDYVKFLQEAISQGISLNDWLLMKIYSNIDIPLSLSADEKKEPLLFGNVETENPKFFDYFKAPKNKAGYTLVSNTILNKESNFLQDCYDNFNIQNKDGKPYITYEIQSNYVRSILNTETVPCKNIKEVTDIISLDAIALDKINKKITLSDIKAQLIILAEKTFESKKDIREFMKDINEVLTDLEN